MIQLIVGLGNPGESYAQTRHNAGAWCLARFANQQVVSFQLEKKFQAQVAKLPAGKQPLLLLPTTYMNHSGRPVSACASFYKIPPQNILVLHDELDLPVGVARLKRGGGHGGHNGLRDLTSALQSSDYLRCRIGIGHPGHRDDVQDYVLHRPTVAEKDQIDDAITRALSVFPILLEGDENHAMKTLNTENES